MQIKNIETLLLQEMEEVRGGLEGTCECYSGAGQASEPGGECLCVKGAAQLLKPPPSTTEPIKPSCTCSGNGAGQVVD